MKYFSIIFFTFCLLSFWGLDAYSDRLYSWEDNEGVVHITEDPPPKNAKNTDIVDFTRPPEQPRDQKQTNQKRQEDTNQRASEGRDKAIEATDTFEDEWDYYDDDDDSDAYFLHKKRKEERQEEMREKINKKHEDSIEGKKREGRNRNFRSGSPSGGRH